MANYIVILLGKEKARTKELSLLQLETTLEKVLHIFGQLIPDSKKTEKVEQLQEELYMGLQQAQAMEKAMAYLEKVAPLCLFEKAQFLPSSSKAVFSP